MGIELKLQLNECELNDSTLSPQFQCPGSQYPISIINNIELHAFINFITKSRYGGGGTKTETNKKMRLI